MALRERSTFLYGFEINSSNFAIDFKNSFGGSELQASLTYGFYSLTSLMTEVKRSMEASDPANTYTVSADRSYNSGTENRVTISTSGSFLSLLFGTGTRNAASTGPTIGFAAFTDRTGALTYTGVSSAGTILVTELRGYVYVPTTMNKKVQGVVNVSAGGVKEALVWQTQLFVDVEFREEPEAKVNTEWDLFTDWAITQKLFEFTPEISSPNTFVECTLESTSADGKGLGWKWTEMLPEKPFYYKTGNIKMRKNIPSAAFI